MRGERWVVLAAAALFAVSLALPAIEGSAFRTLTGMDVLRQGASGWRDGVVAWYANPLLVAALGLTLARWYKTGAGLALAGTLLALSSYSAGVVATGAGRSVPAFSFAIGFYIWLAAFAAAVAAPLVGILHGTARDI